MQLINIISVSYNYHTRDLLAQQLCLTYVSTVSSVTMYVSLWVEISEHYVKLHLYQETSSLQIALLSTEALA